MTSHASIRAKITPYAVGEIIFHHRGGDVCLKFLPEIDDRENGREGAAGITQISFMSNSINFYGRSNGEPRSCRWTRSVSPRVEHGNDRYDYVLQLRLRERRRERAFR